MLHELWAQVEHPWLMAVAALLALAGIAGRLEGAVV